VPDPRSRLLSHFGVLLSADVLVRVMVFGTALVTSRVLGPAGLGSAAVALALISYAGVLGDGGLTTLSQLRLVPAGGRDDRLVATTLTLQTGLSLLLGLALSAVVWLLPFSGTVRTLTLVGLPLLVAQALNLFWVLQADERMRSLARLRVVTQLVTSAVCLAGFAIGWRGFVVVASLWAGLLLADVLTLGVLHRSGRLALARPDRAVGAALLGAAGPYLAAMVLTQVLTNADLITLGLSRPARDAGTYAAAYRIAASLQLVVVVLVTAVFPELVRRSAEAPASAAALVTRLVRLTTRPGFAASALVIGLSGPITRLLYGDAYVAASGLLAVLIVYVPLGYYNSVLAQALVAAGRQVDHLRVITATSVVVVAALVVFVPSRGAQAAAVILLVGEGVSIVGLTVAVRTRLGSSMLPTLVEQLPFLLVPWAAMTVVSHVGPGGWYVTLAAGLVAIAACEAGSRTRLVPELRGML
jgi:O-antigen/teichoic acid export membrane protein